WAIFVGVDLAFSVIRNTAMRFLIPMSANNMKDMTDEAFKRVQSFSADWHADNFAGATVRRLSRAMWGYDMVSDAVVLWIATALLVLVGLSIQLMFVSLWVGVFSIVMVGAYIASNIAWSA